MKKICALLFGVLIATAALTNISNAAQTDIVGPAGSGQFGFSVTVLPNGNIVITDPFYDIPAGAADVGAVYLLNGATFALVSTLTGSAAGDQVGNGGITVLTNGNFVVRSPGWSSNRGAATFVNGATGLSGTVSGSNSIVGTTAGDIIGINGVFALTNGNYVVASQNWDDPALFISNAGAVTWGNGTTGTSGAVSAANSLVGSSFGDAIGGGGVTPLTNGNYVVRSFSWDNGAAADSGAVTWGNGANGTFGAVSSANSIVGSTANDQVGNFGVFPLTNGNYVVASSNWDNGAAADAGAVTWGNGSGGTFGAVSAANSLVGSTANDQIGSFNVTALTNGNYVVNSTLWDNGAALNAGAVTWGNGATGTGGVVSSANSLVGSATSDRVGINGVVALTNGNYVVASQNWDNGAVLNAGAATWGNGATGISGAISSANSLVGTSANDFVGSAGITALTNGNYVVNNADWNNGAATAAGAVTWGNGTSGISGAVSSANSLVGDKANDLVGSGVTALTNGNYVVRSPLWDNPSPLLQNVGAVTWGNGTTGTIGIVSSANSLVGSSANDSIGDGGVTVLTNGNYVVRCPNWDGSNLGAATWGNGSGGTVGAVSSANSLVGSAASDNVSGTNIIALTNGNYVVVSSDWDSGAAANAGAVTWGNGATGIFGAVTNTNSLVGSTANDQIGIGSSLTPLTNGNYVVRSGNWDNPSGPVANASAFTFGGGAGGTGGAITSGTSGGNSVVGTIANGTNAFAFDATRNRLVVGRSSSNAVSILSFVTTAIADGDLNNAANWDNGVPNALLTGIIPSGRTMTISSVMNIGLLQVQCGGSLSGGSASAYIVGSVRKDFCAASNESFTYPIGDPSNYSPLVVSNTNGTGALTASVTDNFLAGLPQAKSLSRFWSLTGAGITTDLTFNYVDADVNGSEAIFWAFKRSASTNLTVSGGTTTRSAAANTFTVRGVSQFSDWSAGELPLAPTAANVSISGRVLTDSRAGLRNAIVYLTKANGETVTARTTSFGYYHFDDIAAGQTVVIGVRSKLYQFTPQVINLNDNLTDVDFIALLE